MGVLWACMLKCKRKKRKEGKGIRLKKWVCGDMNGLQGF